MYIFGLHGWGCYLSSIKWWYDIIFWIMGMLFVVYKMVVRCNFLDYGVGVLFVFHKMAVCCNFLDYGRGCYMLGLGNYCKS